MRGREEGEKSHGGRGGEVEREEEIERGGSEGERRGGEWGGRNWKLTEHKIAWQWRVRR